MTMFRKATRPAAPPSARADLATSPICRSLTFALLLAGACLPAQARDAAPLAADPALEVRVMEVAEELRCLVCQNETIAASQADLAVDLRQQIRSRLARGESRAEILDFMVERYGAFVRYRPALNATTALLWLGPFALLGGGGLALATTLRRHRPGRPAGASAGAASDADDALDDDDDDDTDDAEADRDRARRGRADTFDHAVPVDPAGSGRAAALTGSVSQRGRS